MRDRLAREFQGFPEENQQPEHAESPRTEQRTGRFETAAVQAEVAPEDKKDAIEQKRVPETLEDKAKKEQADITRVLYFLESELGRRQVSQFERYLFKKDGLGFRDVKKLIDDPEKLQTIPEDRRKEIFGIMSELATAKFSRSQEMKRALSLVIPEQTDKNREIVRRLRDEKFRIVGELVDQFDIDRYDLENIFGINVFSD